MSSTDDMTCAYTSPDSLEAAALQAALEEAGIPTRLVGGQAALGFGELPSDALRVDILVPADRASEARTVLEAHWRDHAQARKAREAGAQEWACGQCGEANAPSFDVCWGCQSPRP